MDQKSISLTFQIMTYKGLSHDTTKRRDDDDSMDGFIRFLGGGISVFDVVVGRGLTHSPSSSRAL